jgi:hypothetical protein
MNEKTLTELLEGVKTGAVPVDEAFSRIRQLPFEDLGYANVDHHREIRTGFPEVIFCAGKTVEQTLGIAERMAVRGHNVLGTKASTEQLAAVKAKFPEALIYDVARIFFVRKSGVQVNRASVLVATGGTSDIPVAEEAAVTAELLGNRVDRLFDVGVAGIHRLLSRRDRIEAAGVIIAVAGMEGALASVIGGLSDKPVIAVPTSVGYGSSFGGLAALLAMLNSCASGVGVVNIDNGFGAGYLAAVINRQVELGR